MLINIVQVGENTGHLDLAFCNLADYFELEDVTVKSIKSAMRYPMFVLVSIIVAMVILNIFVIPVFAKVFENSNDI